MSKFLAPRNEFYGEVVFAEGSVVHNSGEHWVGSHDPLAVPGINAWLQQQAPALVTDVTERDAYLAHFITTFGFPSQENPCTVWRADGTSTGLLEMTWNGSDWTPLTPTAGDMEMTLAQGAPPGWILAQGQTLANAATTYPALWENASWGWRVGSDLVLPDLRGRVPIGHGQGTGLTNRTIGQKGGTEKVQLAQSETPLKKHMHGGFDWRGAIRTFIFSSVRDIWLETGNGIAGSGHYYWVDQMPADQPGQAPVKRGMPAAPLTTVPPPAAPGTLPLGWGPWPTSETQSDAATPHENMQPFVVVNYKIKL